MSRKASVSIRSTLLVGAAALAVALPLSAQIPQEFTNLQVLPAGIERRALIDMMRGFSMQLGVRCNHCHVGEDPTSAFADYDFAADDREPKRVARAMIRMTAAINQQHLDGLDREVSARVRCITCHRGQTRPDTLDGRLLAAFDESGTFALIRLYRSLRDELYGHGVYDFSEGALIGVASALARGHSDLGAAQAVLDLNLEFYPESFMTWYSMGELKNLAADREGALAAFQKALEIEPDNEWARQALERLEQ